MSGAEARLPLLQRLGAFWTIPNALSLARLVLVVPITYLIWIDGPLDWLFGLIVAAILTDWFDGRVARWSHTVSAWGKVLDPIADKFAALMTVSALVFRQAEPTLPLWLLLLIVGRDLVIVGGATVVVRKTGRIMASAWLGKAATLGLALTVLAAVLKADDPILQACIWIAAVLLVLSVVFYGAQAVRLIRAARRIPRSDEEEAPVEASAAEGEASPEKEEKPQSVEE